MTNKATTPKPNNDRLKPLSLTPLSAEEALRAALQIKPEELAAQEKAEKRRQARGKKK